MFAGARLLNLSNLEMLRMLVHAEKGKLLKIYMIGGGCLRGR